MNLQLEAEKSLVALLLNRPELWGEIDPYIQPTDLKQGQNSARIFEIGLELAKANSLTKPALIEQVGDEKLVGGYLSAEYNVNRLDNYISIILTQVDLAKYHVRQHLAEYEREIERNKLVPIEERVFRPSLIDVTKKLGGYYRGEMSVLGGVPGSAKSSWELQMVREFAKPNQRTVYIQLEMTAFRTLDRMMVSDSDGLAFEEIIELSFLQNPMKTKDFLRSFANLHKDEIYILTSNKENNYSDWKQLRKAILGYIKLGVRYFAIDSINLMSWSEINLHRNYELEAILRDIIGICTNKDYGYPHIKVIAHLNRNCESRQDKRPMLIDLKDTNGLGQWADLVQFIYRDAMYNPETEYPNVAEILVEKNRNRASPARSRVFFDGSRFTFKNLQHDNFGE